MGKPGRPLICPYMRQDFADLRVRSGLTEEQMEQIWRERRSAALRSGFRKHGGHSLCQSLMRAGVDNPFSTHEAWSLMIKFATEPVQLEVNRYSREWQRAMRRAA